LKNTCYNHAKICQEFFRDHVLINQHMMKKRISKSAEKTEAEL